jgi:hypothetical protein
MERMPNFLIEAEELVFSGAVPIGGALEGGVPGVVGGEVLGGGVGVLGFGGVVVEEPSQFPLQSAVTQSPSTTLEQSNAASSVLEEQRVQLLH